MKVISIISTIFILAFTSCNSWLDITPKDTVDEDKLFTTGDGYRNVLNGVYSQMATPSMYGQELSWGMLDVLGQLYQTRGFSSSTTYYLFSTYNYSDNKTKSKIETIWSQAYNSIANCNSILSKIDGTDSTLFRALNHEKLLIKGEALALRAYLHFDMLRLFAPAQDAQDSKKYIPYFTTYPSTFEPDRSVKEVLEYAIEDLEQARNLVAPHDTIDWREMLANNQRIVSETEANQDLFFKNRGFRMNYLAICALLARVYNYMGEFDAEYYKKSYDIAEHVITFNLTPDKSETKLSFTEYNSTNVNKKRYHEVIFCLSNQKLLENYDYITNSAANYRDKVNLYLQATSTLFDDNADVRWLYTTEAIGRNQICTKNIAPKGEMGSYAYCQDMLPMIRLSELYYIQAEHLIRQGNKAEAINKIDVVRKARNCQIGSTGVMAKKITDLESFKKEVAKEALRDFMQEGQAFFYYKRFKILPKSGMKESDMVLPKPDNETIL